MFNVKTQLTEDYREYILKVLQEPQRAAGNIEIALELEGKDPQPDLLRLTLKDVIESRLKNHTLTPESEFYYQQLDQILIQSSGVEIYAFVTLLDSLGFKLQVSIKENSL